MKPQPASQVKHPAELKTDHMNKRHTTRMSNSKLQTFRGTPSRHHFGQTCGLICLWGCRIEGTVLQLCHAGGIAVALGPRDGSELLIHGFYQLFEEIPQEIWTPEPICQYQQASTSGVKQIVFVCFQEIPGVMFLQKWCWLMIWSPGSRKKLSSTGIRMLFVRVLFIRFGQMEKHVRGWHESTIYHVHLDGCELALE